MTCETTIIGDLTFVKLFNSNTSIMRTSSTFSVLFWIYTKRAKNNLAVIYARITVNGRKLNISLKRKADVSLSYKIAIQFQGIRKVFLI
jgi:hypothetical protein